MAKPSMAMTLAILAPTLETLAKTMNVFCTLRTRGNNAKAMKMAMVATRLMQPPVRSSTVKVTIWPGVICSLAGILGYSEVGIWGRILVGGTLVDGTTVGISTPVLRASMAHELKAKNGAYVLANIYARSSSSQITERELCDA
jgi:hypothetical protein